MLRNLCSSSRFSPVTLDTQKMGAVLCRYGMCEGPGELFIQELAPT